MNNEEINMFIHVILLYAYLKQIGIRRDILIHTSVKDKLA